MELPVTNFYARELDAQRVLACTPAPGRALWLLVQARKGGYRVVRIVADGEGGTVRTEWQLGGGAEHFEGALVAAGGSRAYVVAFNVDDRGISAHCTVAAVLRVGDGGVTRVSPDTVWGSSLYAAHTLTRMASGADRAYVEHDGSVVSDQEEVCRVGQGGGGRVWECVALMYRDGEVVYTSYERVFVLEPNLVAREEVAVQNHYVEHTDVTGDNWLYVTEAPRKRPAPVGSPGYVITVYSHGQRLLRARMGTSQPAAFVTEQVMVRLEDGGAVKLDLDTRREGCLVPPCGLCELRKADGFLVLRGEVAGGSFRLFGVLA